MNKSKRAKRFIAGFLSAALFMTMPGIDGLKVSAEPERTQEETDLSILAGKIHSLYAGADLKKAEETEFGTKNLIVSVSQTDFDLLGAKERISLGNGIYVLSYASEELAEKACASYQKMEGISFVEADTVVKAQTEEVQDEKSEKSDKSDKNETTDEPESSAEKEEPEEAETEQKDSTTEEAESKEPDTEKKEDSARGKESKEEQKMEEDKKEKQSKDNGTEKEKKKEDTEGNTEEDTAEDKIEDAVPEEEKEDLTVRTALLDTGMKTEIENLAFYLQDTGINTSGSGEVGNTADDNGHGSAMAQIIASALEEKGKNSDSVKILPVKVLDHNGYGTTLTVYLGMKAAMEQGADLICLGLSGRGESKLLEQTIKEAVGQGILVTAPAGNDGADVSEYIPGRYSDLLVISSAENQKKPSAKANHGATVDFGAYGVYKVTGLNGAEQEVKGTSMACAYVTGVTASMPKEYSGMQREAELVKQALPVTKADLIPYFGRGLIGEIPQGEEEPEDGSKEPENITPEDEGKTAGEENDETEDQEEIKNKDLEIREKSLKKKGSKGVDITIEKDEKGDEPGKRGNAVKATLEAAGDQGVTLTDLTTINGTINVSPGTKNLNMNGKQMRHGRITNAMIIIQPGATLNIWGGGRINGRNKISETESLWHTQPLIVNRGTLNINGVAVDSSNNNGQIAAPNPAAGNYDGSTSLIYNTGTANLVGCDMAGCHSCYGYTIYNSGGTMVLNSCSIGNASYGNDGGVGNGVSGTMYLQGCTISGNRPAQWETSESCKIGGLSNNGTLFIYGYNNINSNTASGQTGGGIYNGGTIYIGHNGAAENASELHLSWNKTNMVGGGISNNGTIYNYPSSTMFVYGNVNHGIRNNGTFSNSGTISCESNTGEGVYNSNGFYNYGSLVSFSNTSGGVCNDYYLSNSGTMHTYSNGNGGIRNNSSFNNTGNVTSNSNINGGVVNTSGFYNNGSLNTNSNSGGGIRNNSYFGSTGTLYSYGNYNYTDAYGNIIETGIGVINRVGGTMYLNGDVKIGYLWYQNEHSFALSPNAGNALRNAGNLYTQNGHVRISHYDAAGRGSAVYNEGLYSAVNTLVVCSGTESGIYNAGVIGMERSCGIYGNASYGLYNVSGNGGAWRGTIDGSYDFQILNGGTVNSLVAAGKRNFSRGIYNIGVIGMSGGTVQNTGTGLYNTGTFRMSGGIIQNSKTHGVYQDGVFCMSKDAVVNRNNDVYLLPGKYITVDGALTTNGIVANVTPTVENGNGGEKKDYSLAKVIAKTTYSGGKASDALFYQNSGYRFELSKEGLLRPGDYMDKAVLKKEGHPEITGNDIVISTSYNVLYEKNIDEKDTDGNPVNVEVSGMPKTQSKYWCENLKLPNGTDSYQAPTVTTYPYSTYYELERWNDKSDGEGTDYPMIYTYKENKGTTLYAIWRRNFKVAYIGNEQTKGEDFIDEGEDKKGYSEKLDYTFDDNEEAEKEKQRAEDYFQRLDTVDAYTDEETGEVVEQDIEGTVVGWAMKNSVKVDVDKDKSYELKEVVYGENVIKNAEESRNITYDAPNSDFGKFKENDIVAQAQNSVGMNMTSSVLAVGVQKTQDINGGRYVNMYAVWDMGPIIEAYDRYYTLEEAQSGFISEEELLNAAKATDEEVKSKDNEEGRLKNFVDEENQTKFTVMDYQEEEFKELKHSAVISVTYRAEDEAGNVTKKRILVHIVDGHDTVADGYDLGRERDAGKVRFISKKYLDTLDENSVWALNDEYSAALADAVSYERTNPKQSDPAPLLGDDYTVDIPGTGDWNKTPQSVWTFTREQVKEAQQFVEDYGPSNYKHEDGLQKFYEKFSGCRQ